MKAIAWNFSSQLDSIQNQKFIRKRISCFWLFKSILNLISFPPFNSSKCKLQFQSNYFPILTLFKWKFFWGFSFVVSQKYSNSLACYLNLFSMENSFITWSVEWSLMTVVWEKVCDAKRELKLWKVFIWISNYLNGWKKLRKISYHLIAFHESCMALLINIFCK